MTNETALPIAAKGLFKVFRDFWRRVKVCAVHDLTFHVRSGEVFGLLGPNGSGKSTTLKMVLGLLHPTRGTLTVLGHSPRDVQIKSRIGYLPEESYLYPYLTCEETLDFYARLFSFEPRERRKRIEQLLDMIGLTHARNRLVGEFSKGMMRRVGLAQALLNDPDLIILDEPTSGLDPVGCRQIKDLILTLARRGKTVLLSSHLLADVEDVCDRILILYNGRAWAEGSIKDLLEVKELIRITLPEMSREELQRVLDGLQQWIGRPPQIEHPRKNLERFFLEVVQRAQEAMTESIGVRPSQSLAPYLAERGNHDVAPNAP